MIDELVALIRGMIAFFVLLIYTRMLGKHQVSQLTFFDYIIGITVGSITATMTTDLSIRLLPQLIGLTTWMALALLLQVVTLKSRWLRKMVDGEPTVVIQNGKMLEQNMAKLRYGTTDLLESLRLKGVFSPADVEFAILERNGDLAVLKKAQLLPVTPQDLNIPTQYVGVPTEVIVEGELMLQNLRDLHLTQAWVMEQLQNLGIGNIKAVMYASVDTQGTLYVDKYQDQIQNPLDISDYPGPN